MKRFILRIILLGVAFIIVTQIVPGVKLSGNAASAFLAAIVFVVLNLLVSPLVWLLKILALPLTLLTLGVMSLLISFVFNILIFWIIGSHGWGVRVEGASALIFGALLLSVANAVLNLLIPAETKKRLD
jgi:putative membrane protein